MIEPALTAEQQQVRDSFARLCDTSIAPQAQAIDEAGEFPRELFGVLADVGLFGMRYPEADGGREQQIGERDSGRSVRTVSQAALLAVRIARKPAESCRGAGGLSICALMHRSV